MLQQHRQLWVIPIQQQEVKTPQRDPLVWVSSLTIGSISLPDCSWWWSNSVSHGEQKQPSLLMFPPLCCLEYLDALTEALTAVVCIFNFLSSLSFKASSSSRRGHWFPPPPGREDVSPRADWIDNSGLNIALRQEGGGEDIFRSVYGATTRTLPQLNDQTEERKGSWSGTLNTATLSLRDYCTYWDCENIWVDECTVCPVQTDHQLYLKIRKSKLALRNIFCWRKLRLSGFFGSAGWFE